MLGLCMFLSKKENNNITMKRLDKIVLLALFFVLNSIIIISCRTETTQNSTEKNTDTIPNNSRIPSSIDTTKTISEKALNEYIISAKTVKPNSKNGSPFDKLDYDKVIAYDFEGDEEGYLNVIDREGRFVPVVLGQKFLTQEQTDKILSALTSKSTYGEAKAACFFPHFALVFYKKNKMINQISICLTCNNLHTDLEIPTITYKVRENIKTFAIKGFTEIGKKAIRDLCKELDFTYGKEKSKSK